MKKRIKNIISHPLITGSVVIFSGTLFANFLNFIFNWYIKRELSNADYGVFASLISLITLPGLVTGAVGPVVVSYAGRYFSGNKTDLARGFYRKILKGSIIICSVIFLAILLFAGQIASFFRFDDLYLLTVTNFIITLSILLIINQSFLQAKLAFAFISLNSIFGSVLKLVLGALFVFFGFRVAGAIGALLIAFLLPYLVSFIPLRNLLKNDGKTPQIDYREMLVYAVPSAVAVLGSASLITTDLLLVKHFFSADDAGIYAGLSLAARIIYFFSAPIGTVMFPLIVQKHQRSESYLNTFLLSLLLVAVPSLGITFMYALFPGIILNLFNLHSSGTALQPLLLLFAVFISLYSCVTLISSFYLSIRITKVYLPIIIFAFVQGVGIWFYHNSFFEVVVISLISTLLLLIALLLYYPYATKKK